MSKQAIIVLSLLSILVTVRLLWKSRKTLEGVGEKAIASHRERQYRKYITLPPISKG